MIKFTSKLNTTLLKILSSETRLPFSVISKKLREKQVMINNERIKENCPVFVGDEIIIFAEVVKNEIQIVYENELIAILDKPSGIETKDFEKEVWNAGYKNFEAMHRLDRNTSGLLIFAKNKPGVEYAKSLFKEEKLIKTYYANVFGRPQKAAKLRAYHKKNSEAATVMVFGEKVKGSEEILTEYKLLKQNGEISTLEVVLREGGKTHQIRAHLAFVGLPLVGDGKYGSTEMNKKYKRTRHELRCVKLECNDFTSEKIQ